MWRNQQRISNFNTPGLIQSLVITSDPQYPWTDCTDGRPFETCGSSNLSPCSTCSQSTCPEDQSTKERRSEALILQQYSNINMYTDTVQNASVLINGDMTAFGHDDIFNPEWRKIKEFLGFLKRPYYFGLGNHDIQNNFNNCANNGCFKNSLENLISHVQGYRLPSSQFDYRTEPGGTHWGFPVTRHLGSFAYTVNFGSICSIQLQNFPTTNAMAEPTITNPNEFHIFENLNWFEDQLRLARQNRKTIIVNVHKPDDWAGGPSTRFKNLLQQYNVAAVFCGHYHTTYGEVKWAWNYFDSIPVFLSGGASQRTYLILEQFSDRLDIYSVTCNDWRSRTLARTIKLPIS
ncbi:hypothetical protein BK784_00015 [Bacillus thuringiensis serovar medellin]|uniref:Calcineurin-like phosphoesterase domain-containing protein n=1 Tax=Bacillus thuringiensis subsp. medellin TaxID=79672 RepID=A0A9X6NFC0_BACTV|nr:metallophosphoesterase [Bacillus thuringiensis]OUC04085.1 hypothetical protein BK784_00015 [Bacillus thuringiensis serovar medellin]